MRLQRSLSRLRRFVRSRSNCLKKLLNLQATQANPLVDSLDRGTKASAERIRPLESLVRQMQYLLLRWEMFALRSVLWTSVYSHQALPTVSASNGRVGPPAYDISMLQGEFQETECDFSVSPIGSSPDNSSHWVLSSNVSLTDSISSITYIL